MDQIDLQLLPSVAYATAIGGLFGVCIATGLPPWQMTTCVVASIVFTVSMTLWLILPAPETVYQPVAVEATGLPRQLSTVLVILLALFAHPGG